MGAVLGHVIVVMQIEVWDQDMSHGFRDHKAASSGTTPQVKLSQSVCNSVCCVHSSRTSKQGRVKQVPSIQFASVCACHVYTSREGARYMPRNV
jgi:hypothetical protein